MQNPRARFNDEAAHRRSLTGRDNSRAREKSTLSRGTALPAAELFIGNWPPPEHETLGQAGSAAGTSQNAPLVRIRAGNPGILA